MKFRSILLLILMLLLAACTPGENNLPPGAATPTLRDPMVNTTTAPSPDSAAKAFLDAWKADNYAAMYAQLTLLSKDALIEDDFSNHMKDVSATMSLESLDYEILQSLIKNPSEAQVAYRMTYHTVLVGDIVRETVMNMSLQDETWKVQWEDGMILPELRGGNRLTMDISVPARGNIYDKNGSALAAQSDAVALGIEPGQINPDTESALLTELSNLTNLNPDYIASLYEFAEPGWYIPVGDVSAQEIENRFDVLTSLGGAIMSSYNTRYYFDQAAAHAVGYVQPIPIEQVDEYRRLGYRVDERVGMVGLETWGEEYLTGQRGASLYVVDQQGSVITRLGERESKPANEIYSTLDKDLQVQTQRAIEGFRGAVVVLERDTGRVLAMASSPTFDPNLFDPNNFNSGYLLGEVYDPATLPLLNRATNGQYPLGSVFKIITMATALETGVFTQFSEYNCLHTFTEIPGVTLYDWTYEKERPASGLLTLPEGLMRSCNPWFYHIGLELYQLGYTEDVSKMARSFGLGSPTGIEQLDEAAGNMPTPISQDDAVQLAIGQGAMLATPLQVARFIAAVGNGGTLYRPQIVERVTTPDGQPLISFKADPQGTLPVSEENLKIIQDAMRAVVADTRGTARTALAGLGVPVYGKTGTASNSTGTSHAWFAGYTDAGREDLPDIAIAVIAENAGEGSEIAAPIFRRVVEAYYFGRPSRLYPWEASFYVTKTPTPEGGETEETPQP
ncbi:MAG TPA: penicillin-binding transpeptidase domain-containing protein [Bellilinea sp.]|nr:penicillin-binding transpeptidase domain-containing protein [Bellilinea sp.]